MVDFERRESGEVDKEGLEQFIEDYENYKDPHNMNRWFVDNVEEKGLKFKSRLKYVQISISSSSFDKIEKVK